jgi:hypothetical protein
LQENPNAQIELVLRELVQQQQQRNQLLRLVAGLLILFVLWSVFITLDIEIT